jgi:DNA-binding NarL/FixJ family response regulator
MGDAQPLGRIYASGCPESDLPGNRTPMSQATWKLSPREMDVLALLVKGKSNREIAAELNLSLGTVKSHLSSMYKKLGVSNRTQAALVGVRIFPMLRVLAS